MSKLGVLTAALAVFLPAQDPESRTPDIDELVSQLPRIGGARFWESHATAGLHHPAARQLKRFLDEGGSLSDSQWRDALFGSGAIRARTRWPAELPFAVSLRVPEWLEAGRILLTPAPGNPLTRPASTSLGYWALSTTSQAGLDKDALYQELGALEPGEPGEQVLRFDVEVARGYHVQHGPTPPPGTEPARPEAGILWTGEIELLVAVVPTVVDALPGVDSPEIRRDVAESVGVAIAAERLVAVTLDLDPGKRPALRNLAVSVDVELIRDDMVIERTQVAAEPVLYIPLPNEDDRFEDLYFGFSRLETRAADIDPPGRWSLRVRGSPQGTVPQWERDRHWAGTVTIPLAQAIERERIRSHARARPQVRGPLR